MEGAKTEPHYFALFNNQTSVIRVSCIRGKHDSAPPYVLKRMRNHLKREELRSDDEAWLVVDKDQWTSGQLDALEAWAEEADNYGFALSNPNFEYRLLLHFEDGNAVASASDCVTRLKSHLPK